MKGKNGKIFGFTQKKSPARSGLVDFSAITVDNIRILTRSVSEGPRFFPRLRFGLGFPPGGQAQPPPAPSFGKNQKKAGHPLWPAF